MLIPEYFFYFQQKLFFFSPAYFYFGIVAHDHHAAFAALVFFYMMKIDEKRFMNAEEMKCPVSIWSYSNKGFETVTVLFPSR